MKQENLVRRNAGAPGVLEHQASVKEMQEKPKKPRGRKQETGDVEGEGEGERISGVAPSVGKQKQMKREENREVSGLPTSPVIPTRPQPMLGLI